MNNLPNDYIEMEDFPSEESIPVSENSSESANDPVSDSSVPDNEAVLGQDSEGLNFDSLSDDDFHSLLNFLNNYEKQNPVSDSPALFSASASNVVSFDRSDNVYSLKIGSSNYNVLFPVGASLDVRDGMLVNVGSSNVTGIILRNGSNISLQTYAPDFYTLYPITSINATRSLYNYGASGYITHYYVNSSGTNLTSSTSYGNAEVLNSPRAFTGWSVPDICITFLLVASVAISLLRILFGGSRL